MTPLQKHLKQACGELGVKVLLDYEHKLPSGRTILSSAWIPDFGARKGILVLTFEQAKQGGSWREYESLLPEIKEMGFTVSIMGEGNDRSRYDLVSWMETLADWQWKGPMEERPKWLDSVPAPFDEDAADVEQPASKSD